MSTLRKLRLAAGVVYTTGEKGGVCLETEDAVLRTSAFANILASLAYVFWTMTQHEFLLSSVLAALVIAQALLLAHIQRGSNG